MKELYSQSITYEQVQLEALAHADMRAALNVWKGWNQESKSVAWDINNLFELPNALIPLASLAEAVDGGLDFRYKFWGSRLADVFGAECTSTLLSEHPKLITGATMEQMSLAFQSPTPLYFVSTLRRPNRIPVKKHNLRFPIAVSDGTVSMVLTISHLEQAADEEDLTWVLAAADC